MSLPEMLTRVFVDATHGMRLRVQHLGVRFDPDEMLRDLRSLLGEASAR